MQGIGNTKTEGSMTAAILFSPSCGKHSSSKSDAISFRRHTFRFAIRPQGGGQGNLLRRESSSKLLRTALASGRRPSLAALCLASADGGGRELSYSQPHSSRDNGARAAAMPHDQLLDRFWRARGVMDDSLRKELVDTGLSGISQGEGGDAADAQAIQEDKSWVVATSEAGDSQVAAIGRRLADLNKLMGAGRGYEDIDVVWMVLREPRLLTAELSRLRKMLVEMKVADGCEGIDVAKICEAQPALLLQDVSEMDSEESFAQRMQAWQYGFVTDNDAEWSRRFGELQEYTKLNGDAHVGCREGDDKELTRWAKKQRAAFKSGELDEARLKGLQALQFEFLLEDAEWKRWHRELATFFLIYGHSSPVPLSDLTNYYLINWCCVQRIARRNGVMSEARIQMLDDLEFDWTGADPLS